MKFDSRFASPLVLQARQQGSTLIGFIVGLVVGLSVAVVVALAITKGSTPFTDKSGKLGKVPEPTAGQITDPNKPLYGSKDAAREANKEFQKDPAPAASGGAPAVVDAKAPVKPETKPAAVPGPSTAPSTAAAPVAPAVASDAGAKPVAAVAKPDAPADVVYYLQTGAFREVADAESARAKLALLGYEATISDRTSDNSVLHRVRLGPYTQVDAMNKIRTKLNENGIDVAVMRNQK